MNIAKKALAVILAFCMVMSSCALMSSAFGSTVLSEADFENNADVSALYTVTLYRNDGTNWVPTTVAKPGEALKARISLKTGFPTAFQEFITLWDPDMFTDSLSTTVGSAPSLNTESTFAAAYAKDSAQYPYSCGITTWDQLHENDNTDGTPYVDDETYAKYQNAWVKLLMMSSAAATPDGSEWQVEIPLTVKDKAPASSEMAVGIFSSAWSTWCLSDDYDLGMVGLSGIGNEDNLGFYNTEPGLWEPRVTTVDATLSTVNTVKLDANGGAFAKDATAEATGTVGSDVTPDIAFASAPAGKSLTSVKWSDAKTTSYADASATIPIGYDTNKTYYAIYDTATTPTHTVTFKANGGSFAAGATTTKTVAEGADITAETITVPTWTGHTFKGWATNKDDTTGETDSTKKIATMGDKDTEIFATWEINKWKITYKLDGVKYGDPVEYEYGATVTPKGDPTVANGYHFSGWQTEPTAMPDNDVEVIGTSVPNNYTVSYELDGAAYGTPSDDSFAYNTDVNERAAASKTGYSFSGWTWYNSNGDVITKPTKMPADNLTVKGTLSINNYTVSYLLDGDAYGEDDSFTFDTAVNEKAAASKDGYNFSGWTWYNSNGDVITKPTKMPAENLTVKGTLSANNYTVSYLLDGEAYGEDDSFTFDTAVNEKAAASKTGYDFSGWTWYNAKGDVITKPTKMPAENLTVKGTLTAKQITIHFNAGDGGSFGIDPVDQTTIAYGSAIDTTGITEPSKTGYTFDYWSRNSNATEKTDLGNVDSESTIELYAIYKINTYYITYFINDVQYKQDPYEFGAAVTADEGPNDAGYDFSGWIETIPTAMPAENVDIHGLKTAIDYTVNIYAKDEDGYYLLDGKGTANIDDVIEADTLTDSFGDDAALEGYELVGWSDEEDGETADSFTVGAADINIYAIYEAADVVIEFYADILDAEPFDDAVVSFGDTIDAPATEPTKENYDFAGWVFYEDDASLENDAIDFENNAPVADIPDYMAFAAKWTPKKYTVTWDANGGTWADEFDNTTKDVFDAEIVKIATEPTPPEGYSFDGWSKTKGGAVVEYDMFGNYPANNETIFYACYSVNSYKVKWDATTNGGSWATGVNDTTEGDYDTAITEIKATPIAPTGYAFSGWATDPEGEVIKDGAYGKFPANDETVFYAIYTAQSFTVSYELDGEAYGTPAYDSFTFDTDVTERDAASQEGYDFSGWTWYNSNGDVITKPTKMPADNLTVKGTLTPKTITVTFNANSGEFAAGATIQFIQAYGSDITAPTVTRAGYDFAGWSPAFTGKVPATNTEYVAQWTDGQSIDYTIAIYIMDESGNYNVEGTVTNQGANNQTVTLTAGDPPTGFFLDTESSVLTGTVSATTPLVLKIYYARLPIAITFDGVQSNYLYGQTIDYSDATAPAGQTFLGWSVTQGATAPDTDLPEKATEAKNFYSVFGAASYTITYYVDNGDGTYNMDHEDSYAYGAAVTAYAPETKEGYTFSGWNITIPEEMGAENLVAFGSFKLNTHTVTFINGVTKEIIKTFTNVAYGAQFPSVDVPTVDGYNFVSFSEAYTEMPDKDVIVTLNYEEQSAEVKLIAKDGSGVIIDRENGLIYGLKEGIDKNDYETFFVAVQGKGHVVITAAGELEGYERFGTGTKIEVVDDDSGAVVETFYVVIFGDVNGDGRVTTTDLSMMKREVNNNTFWSENREVEGTNSYNKAKAAAANVKMDTKISPLDISVMQAYLGGCCEINQSPAKLIIPA